MKDIHRKPPNYCCGLLSVRMITAMMCAGLIILATLATLSVTFHFSLTAADNIATMHVVAITKSSKTEILNFLNQTIFAVISWRYTFANELLLPKDENPQNPQNPLWYQTYWRQFVSAMRTSDFKFKNIGMVFTDGSQASCHNDVKYLRCLSGSWGNESGTNYLLTRTFTRSRFSYVSDDSTIIEHDPRLSKRYDFVTHTSGTIMWSDVFLYRNLTAVSLNAAIFNETGTMIGALSLDINLFDFDSFIDKIVPTPNSVSFLLDNKQLLMSTSYSVPLETFSEIPKSYNESLPHNCLKSSTVNENSNYILVCRETILSYPYLPLRELQSSYPNIIDKDTTSVSTYTFNGIKFFVTVSPIVTPLSGGINWRVIFFVPVNDIIGGIYKGRDIAIYISVFIVILAVIISFLFVTLLLRPLGVVASEMYPVATFRDVGGPSDDFSMTTGTDGINLINKNNTIQSSVSMLSEIGTLQFAFNALRTELSKIRSYLPESVLAELYENEGNGSLDEGDVMEMSTPRERLSQGRDVATSRGSGTSIDLGTQRTALSHGSKTLNTALCLSHRRVSILSINIVGFHATISSTDISKIMYIHSALVTAISSACKDNKGVMDGFLGDRFLASFNAVTSVGNHSLQAVYAAHTVYKAAETNRTPLVVAAGVASGPALVGNMGSTTIKRFTILGHVVSTAVILERLVKRYRSDGGVLVGGVAVNDVENFFDVLTVDAAVLPISTDSLVWRARIAAVMSPKSATSDEWMYELQEGSKKSIYGDANLAFATFLEGDEAKAKRILETLFDGKHDPDSTSVGEALRKLMSAETAVDGRVYVCPMTDYYLQCMLPVGKTTASNITYIPKSLQNSITIFPNTEEERSSSEKNRKCSVKNVCNLQDIDNLLFQSISQITRCTTALESKACEMVNIEDQSQTD